MVIGTLREEGLLGNTVICFTADHGDMLGNHGLWAKRLFFEESANVPMILLGGRDGRVPHHAVDDRLAGWQDVMPTLLDLAGVDVPGTVEGLSMVGEERRGYLYGEWGEGPNANRMIRAGRHKLIYYPVGNRVQLFDLESDPGELNDLAGSEDHAGIQAGSASSWPPSSTAATKPGSGRAGSSACRTGNGRPAPTATSRASAACTIRRRRRPGAISARGRNRAAGFARKCCRQATGAGARNRAAGSSRNAQAGTRSRAVREKPHPARERLSFSLPTERSFSCPSSLPLTPA